MDAMRGMVRNGGVALALLALGLVGAAPAKPKKSFNDAVTKLEAVVVPSTAARGQTVTLKITMELSPGWHTYPTYQVDPVNESTVNTFQVPATKDLVPVGAFEDPPAFKPDKDFPLLREYEGKITWERPMVVRPDAVPGEAKVTVVARLLACDESICLPKETRELTASLTITSDPPKEVEAQYRDAVQKSGGSKPDAPAPPGGNGGDAVRNPGVKAAGATPSLVPKSESSLWALLLTSIGAAIAMLFTPCVFPMIPITVSFFLKQSEKEHHKPFLTAGVYSLTIIVVLAVAVLVLGNLIVTLANSAWLNLGLGAVLIFFALSLFGMYEIELPNFLARFTAAREGQGGYMGTVFMALTFTITSFTCTGPFLGPLLVGAKEFQLSTDRLIVASFAYSATFAAPFFVMALFPSLLKKLPRSGGWLNSVKVVMGFLELAAALKFLGNMDLALNPGNARIFTFESVLCAWIALSAACGLYLLGLYRLPHDSPAESVGVPRMVLATIFLGLALYMVPALFRKVPDGLVGEALYAFLPLDTAERAGPGATAGAGQHLDWPLEYQKAWAQATKENKPIFIDFTGVNCTNCRANEDRIFPRKEVRDELAKFVCVQLYTDSVPRRGLSPAEAQAEGERNKQLQDRMFHDVSTPMYVVFYPDKAQPFDGDRLNGSVADPDQPIYSGYIRDTADFINFLKNGQRKQVAQVRAVSLTAALRAAAKRGPFALLSMNKAPLPGREVSCSGSDLTVRAYFRRHRPKRLGLRSTSPTSPTSSVAPPTLLRSAPLAALTPALSLQRFDLTLLLLDFFGCRALTAIRFPTRDEAIEELRQLVGCRPDGAAYPQPGPQAAQEITQHAFNEQGPATRARGVVLGQRSYGARVSSTPPPQAARLEIDLAYFPDVVCCPADPAQIGTTCSPNSRASRCSALT